MQNPHRLCPAFFVPLLAIQLAVTLYAATTNPEKLREFTDAARIEHIEVLAVPGLASMPEPVEDAPNFMGNAERKAVAYSHLAPGLLVFADDSGLEVDALGGQPGVRSARFADDLHFEPPTAPNARLTKDDRNNQCVLSLLHQLEVAGGPPIARGARFVCALALARHGKVLLRAEGTVPGELLGSPRGADGFGYDPLFLLRSRGLTLAELSREEKWAISHRGNAFRALLEQLRSPACTIAQNPT